MGVDESEPESGWISWVSPLGRALIGARTGDVVTVRLPEQTVKLKISKVEYK